MSTLETVAKSTTPIEEHRFTWTISNFRKICESKQTLALQQYKFQMGSTVGLSTKWICYLECQRIDGIVWIGAFVCLDDESTGKFDELWITLKVNITSGVQRSNISTSPLHNIVSTGEWGYYKLIRKSNFYIANHVSRKGNLHLEVELNLFNLRSVSTAQVKTPLSTLVSSFQEKFFRKFQTDMANMHAHSKSFGSIKFIKIISKDGKTFSVNPGILAARSPVFRSMLQMLSMFPILEENQNVIKVDDICGAALDALLRFMHTGSLPDNWKEPEIIEGFTYGAYKYLLEDLQKFLDQV